jgi:hypothetical protein
VKKVVAAVFAYAVVSCWDFVAARVLHTGATEPLNEPLNEPLIQYAPRTAPTASAPTAKQALPSAEEREEGRKEARFRPTNGVSLNTESLIKDIARGNRLNRRQPRPEPFDIAQLVDNITGGNIAMDKLLADGRAMTLGGLVNYVAAHGESLDAAAFIISGAVYRDGQYVFPVGCRRVGQRGFYMKVRT